MEKCACDASNTELPRAEPANPTLLGVQMITSKPAIAVMAAAALLFSTASFGANRGAAVAARDAAKSGSGARLSASLAVLQKAAERRVPQQTITHNLKHKLPALRASQGYVSV